MCICIHCTYVDRCVTYYAVETQHEQPHLATNPDFQPLQPQIHVNIRQSGREMEWDVVGCESFVSEPHKWARLRPDLPVPT